MTTIFDVTGTKPSNPFTPLIQQAFQVGATESTKHDEIAAQIVETVTSSPKPATALWSLWDAFFVSIATPTTPGATTSTSDSFAPHFALLNALRAHPPTTPTNVAAASDEEAQLRNYTDKADGKLHWTSLPAFDWQWRDVHDILEARRDWDGIVRPKDSEATTTTTTSAESERHDPAGYFLRFIDFSVALVRERHQHHDAGTLPVWVFFNCKNVLERETPQPPQRRKHAIAPEQVWALDVRVTAMWVRGAGRVLWETDVEELRKHYAAALGQKTELWPRTDGLTRERWELWGKRLRELGAEEEGKLDGETRAVVKEAAEVVEGLLQGK
jgi:hypothetical protein